jgi:hypothetical protein
MTQIVLNIEDVSLLPSLKKILGAIKDLRYKCVFICYQNGDFNPQPLKGRFTSQRLLA